MIDIWYPEYSDKINRMDCFFYDLDLEYRGNLYVDNMAVGDYHTEYCTEVDKIAAKFGITWNWGK